MKAMVEDSFDKLKIGLSSVFSLLFEVADKSFEVADRAIHGTCGVEGRL